MIAEAIERRLILGLVLCCLLVLAVVAAEEIVAWFAVRAFVAGALR